MIDVAIWTLIKQHATGVKRVKPSTDTVSVKGDRPLVIYTLIAAPRTYNDDGPVGVITADYQLDVFHDLDAHAFSDLIRMSLDGYSGTVDSTPIIRITFPSDHFGAGVKLDGEEQTVARHILEMRVSYREQSTNQQG